METENLKFKLELWATMWQKSPHVEIYINSDKMFEGDVTGTEDHPTVIEFKKELQKGEHYLTIHRTGKDKYETVIENGKIVKDQMLHIKNIEIDEIEIGSLVYNGIYTPEYPEPWLTQQKEAGIDVPTEFTNATRLGHNGTWKLRFESAFYMWLLENLY